MTLSEFFFLIPYYIFVEPFQQTNAKIVPREKKKIYKNKID